MAQRLGDLIQSSTDSGEAKAARLVTDLVTGGTLAAEMGLSHPPGSPSEEHELLERRSSRSPIQRATTKVALPELRLTVVGAGWES